MSDGLEKCVLAIQKNCNIHTWINVCYLSSFCDAIIVINYMCFVNENMVKPVQNEGIFM